MLHRSRSVPEDSSAFFNSSQWNTTRSTSYNILKTEMFTYRNKLANMNTMESEIPNRCRNYEKSSPIFFGVTTKKIERLKYSCQICYSTPSCLLPQCSSCDSTFCSSCITVYLQHKISDGQVNDGNLICPGINCSRQYAKKEVHSLVDSDVFLKYLYFKEARQPGVQFCPNKSCGALQHNKPSSKQQRKLHCNSCGQTSCLRCGKEYHSIGLCKRMDRSYRKWRRKHNVRKCPQCKWEIEKTGGCSHMVCSRCSYEFCWLCIGSWHDHNDWGCLPKALYYSDNAYFGFTPPVRLVTKSITAGLAVGVMMIGITVAAAVALPTAVVYHFATNSCPSSKHRNNDL